MESWCCVPPTHSPTHPPTSMQDVSNYCGVIRLLCQVKSGAYGLCDCLALSTTVAFALYSRDSVDMWDCVYLVSSHAEQEKIWSFLANQLVKSLWEVSLQCPHLSQRSLRCKSALTFLRPLYYAWCWQWDWTSRALERLYGDDKMYTTTCV